MATTKRKESAALFELLDKSTLKVPKNANSLKIPNWWSSPTNPPAPRTGAVTMAPRPIFAPARTEPIASAPLASPSTSQAAASAPPPMTDAVAVMAEASDSALAVEEMPAQPRLFDPPPPNVAPPSSPSIRPPTIGVNPVHIVPLKREQADAVGDQQASSPSAVAPAEPVGDGIAPAAGPAGVIAAEKPAVRSGDDIVSLKAAPVPPPAAHASAATKSATEAASSATARRIFAPQTHVQARRGWTAPRPGAFARLPIWAALSAVAGLILIIGTVVFIAKRMNHTTATPNTPLPSVQSANNPAGNLGPTAGHPESAPTLAAAPAFSPELYYVIVWSIPVPPTDAAKQRAWSKAGEYVSYLERNHVGAVAEMVMDPQRNNMLLYTVIATQGFSSASAAQDYKVEIVRIGDALSRGVWKDANPKKGLGAMARGN